MVANYLHFPGVTGNFAWVLDDPTLDGTGTLEFIAKVNLDDWTPDANQIWISKWTGSAGYLFYLESASNDLKLIWRDSGPARIAQATVTPTITDGDWLWVRAVATEDGVDRDVFFYTSTDTTNDPDDVTWIQLGAEVVVLFGAADLTTNTTVVFVGAQSATVATMAGSIAAARVNFAGVTELDIDFTDLTTAEVDAGSFTEDSGNAATVTIAGTAWAYVRGVTTYVLAAITQNDGTELRLEIDFDNADAVIDPKEEYGPLDPTSGDLILFRVVNTSMVTGSVLIAQKTGPKTKFWDVPCPPGVTHISAPGGGSVQKADVLDWQISTKVPQ